MACAFSETAEECAAVHWSKALDGRREPSGQWRADCPVPGCRTGRRGLEYDVPGKSIRWKTFCGEHDKEAVRPHLAKLVGQCMPKRGRDPVLPADLQALALSDLPPLALRTQMLVLSGMSTTEALDKLGVDRTTRYRVRDQLSQFGDKPAGR